MTYPPKRCLGLRGGLVVKSGALAAKGVAFVALLIGSFVCWLDVTTVVTYGLIKSQSVFERFEQELRTTPTTAASVVFASSRSSACSVERNTFSKAARMQWPTGQA